MFVYNYDNVTLTLYCKTFHIRNYEICLGPLLKKLKNLIRIKLPVEYSV